MKKVKKQKTDNKPMPKPSDGTIPAECGEVGKHENAYVLMKTMRLCDLVEGLVRAGKIKTGDFSLDISENMMRFKARIVENAIGVMIRLGIKELDFKVKEDSIEVKTGGEPYCYPLMYGIFDNVIDGKGLWYYADSERTTPSELIKTSLSDDKNTLTIKINRKRLRGAEEA